MRSWYLVDFSAYVRQNKCSMKESSKSACVYACTFGFRFDAFNASSRRAPRSGSRDFLGVWLSEVFHIEQSLSISRWFFCFCLLDS